MSLILVVAREPGSDEPDRAADTWLGWLAVANVELGQDSATVDYTDSPADAMAAAGAAIRDGRRQVAIIPVAEDTSASSIELSELSTQVAHLASRNPDASVQLVGAPPNRPPTFSEILSELHPPDSEDPQLLSAAIERAFGGDTGRFGQFVSALQAGVPPGTTLALRGSVIQGYAYKSDEPFDAKGPGTSDLDVVLFGDQAMAAWRDDGFVVRGVNTLPLSDETAWLAPSLDPARREAQTIARRPVSIQAMAPWFLDLRAALQVQPYVVLNG